MKNEFKEVQYSLTKKLSVSFFSILIGIAIIIASVAYFYTQKQVYIIYSKIATSCSLDVANMLKGVPFGEFLQGNEQELYQNHLKSIRNIANTFGLKYLYVYVPDVENDRLVAIFGVEGKTGNIIESFGLGESPKELRLNADVMRMFNNGDKELILEMNNRYGHVITAYSTIFDHADNSVAVVGSDIDFGAFQSKLVEEICRRCFFIFITFSLIYLLFILYIKNTFIKPILLLSTKMRNFVKEGSFRYSPVKLNTNDEFNIMADSYNIMAKSIQVSIKHLFDAQMETIFSLAKLVQTRDDSTGKHIERVQAYCKILTIAVKVYKIYPNEVDKKFIKNVVNASPLHDIGKVAIDDMVLLTSQRLNDEQIKIMQQHTIYGEQTLAKVNSKFGNNDFIKTGMLIARSHHEKWNGTGYPDGLKGEDIPLAARIAAIADVYDALASKRVYKPAFPHSKCVQIIREERGKHFDPKLVDLFLKIEHKFLKIRQSFEAQEIKSFFDEAETIL